MLLNPKKVNYSELDARSRQIMEKTIAFFEGKGKKALKKDDHEVTWYADFLDFAGKEGILSDLLTPSGEGNQRFDSFRNTRFNEILGFYGLAYWYTWQVSILGLGPIWMSGNEKAKAKARKLLSEGHIFAFGLSEKEHGADIYSSDMIVTKSADFSTNIAKGEAELTAEMLQT